MAECKVCGDEATKTVVFRNPEERLPYCDEHARPAERLSDEVKPIENGVSDIKEAE